MEVDFGDVETCKAKGIHGKNNSAKQRLEKDA